MDVRKNKNRPFSKRVKAIVTPLTNKDNRETGYASIGSFVCEYRFGVVQTLAVEIVELLKNTGIDTLIQTQAISEDGIPYVKEEIKTQPRYNITLLPSDVVDTEKLGNGDKNKLNSVVTK